MKCENPECNHVSKLVFPYYENNHGTVYNKRIHLCYQCGKVYFGPDLPKEFNGIDEPYAIEGAQQ